MSRLEIDSIYRNEPYLLVIKRRKPTGRPAGRPPMGSGLPGAFTEEEEQATKDAMEYHKKLLEDALTEGLATKTWIAIIDNQTCNGCRALNFTTIPIDGVFTARGISVYASPLHPSCRCSLGFGEAEKLIRDLEAQERTIEELPEEEKQKPEVKTVIEKIKQALLRLKRFLFGRR